ncbi:DUF2294 domain-containing protein [Limnoraphis robusta]|uniref:Na+-translocating membrane potential-generating system MpsC domain-containing protein n=1 Tax=Limnoraphis robusta CS-951 TaxID=1637645 RepID=A0A0J9HMS2_9CYAN|nr:hypothetical protein WN50_34840 [Limnoraphis robusta CS-951]
MEASNLALSEQLLCEGIQKIYTQQLEQQLIKISCHIFDRIVVFILEGVITPPEHFLNRNNDVRLVSRVRGELDRIIQPKIKDLIEKTINVTVTDFLCDTAIDTDRTGAIVIFEFPSRTASLKTSDDGTHNRKAL